MENFLNDTDDHDSSFFQPSTHHDDDDLFPAAEEVIVPPPPPVATTSNINPVNRSETTDRPRLRRDFDEEANIKLQVLVSNFSDEQLDRYEMYRRSAFSKVSIKRLMHSITGAVPSSNVVIAMAGVAKVFVGEIVEEALEIQRQEMKDEQKPTPLEPKHLREACRRIRSQPHIPPMKTWKTKRKSRF